MSASGIQPDDVSTLLERFTAVPAATRFGGIPATSWARVAMALHALHGAGDAIVVVDVAEGGPILLDWGRHDYWWPAVTGALPVEPTITNVRLYREPGARLPYMLEKPDDLGSLLWWVGLHAFPHEAAWWLREDSRYKLTGWPDFTSISHELEHVRMTALLGSSPHSVAELARATSASHDEAQSLINALSLMGLLTEISPDESSAPVRQKGRGLFARLRSRLGV